MASNWKKKISRPTVLFRQTRPRSTPVLSPASSPASEAVKRYDEEAEKCLRDLELEAGLLNHGRDGKSPNSEDIMRASMTTTTTTSTNCVSSPDLLGTFCHLMNYVVHLRRENRHLRKQVLCLHEMRQIEQLQNELLRSACTCETGATAAAALVDVSDKKDQAKKHWRHSMPVGVTANGEVSSMKSNSTSTSLATITTIPQSRDMTPSVTIRKGVSAGGLLRAAGGEMSEKRSLHSLGQKPSAPVTTSVGPTPSKSQPLVKPQQQSSSKSRRFLAPPTPRKTVANFGRGCKYKIVQGALSASSSGSVDGLAKRAPSPSHSQSSASLTRSLLSPSLWCGRQSANSVRHGAEEALAEVQDERAFLLMHSSLGEDSLSYSPRSISSGGSSSLTKSYNAQMPSNDSRDASLRRDNCGNSGASVTDSDDLAALKATVFFLPHHSDSEDQSVFTEVHLPDYRRPDRDPGPVTGSCEVVARKNSSSPRVWRFSDASRLSGGSGYAALALPEHDGPIGGTATVQKASPGILTRLGLKRPSVLLKRRGTKTSVGDESPQPDKALIAPLVSKSMYDEKVGRQNQQMRPQSLIDLPPDKWKMAKKAFLKKRKRKISESDSLASSASGKSYMTIELPDISYSRKISSPPAVPIITTVDVDCKDYAVKMRQWETERQIVVQHQNKQIKENEEGGIIRRMSLKGQQLKRGWLRKPKCVEGDEEPRYFEKDDGRQNTVVEIDVNPKTDGSARKPPIGWSVSDTDISRKSTLDELSPRLGGPSETCKHQRQQQQPEEQQKLRSVTFLEQLSPVETTLSLTTSQQLTISNDSVFTSPDAELQFCRLNGLHPGTTTTKTTSRELQRQQQQQASDVVEQLLILQERNSLLIKTLKDKTKEYERITERLCDLEKEVQTLRERHRFDTNLEQLYNAVLEPNFVPVNFVQELEKQVEDLDHNIRVIKSEAYETQQMALETHANDQATTMRYLNQIDNLQKANFHLLSKNSSELNRDDYPEIRRQLELLPTYEALYSFTINLLRKLKHIRTRLLEKNFSVSKLDLELLQTQSSLLLAQAQIERQKMEMRLLKANFDVTNSGDFMCDRKAATIQSVRRTHSYHGQDILARAVNSELSFYLPFKLHGFRTMKRDRESNMSVYNGDETLELEFAKLFDTVNRLSGHYDEIQLPLQSNTDQKDEETQTQTPPLIKTTQVDKSNVSAVELRMRWRRNGQNRTKEGDSPKQARPTSCNVPVKETEVKRIAEEITAGRYFMSSSAGSPPIKTVPKAPPNYLKKAPPPLKLGNVGQVKAMAAAFDVTAEDTSSAPNTPLAKTAPHLMQKRVAPVKEVRLTKPTSKGAASRMQEMKPASHRRDFDRPMEESKSSSKIPVRAGLNQSQLLSTSTKSAAQSKAESPYETLTFMCRESNLVSPPPSISQLSPSTSYSAGIMEKSTSPDMETTSSMASTGSTWSISKRNEVKKMQFLYGSQQRQARSQCPEVPTSPVPPSSPTPRTPPTPIPPTPTLPNATTRFPELVHTPSDKGIKPVKAKDKGRTESGTSVLTTSSIPVPEKTPAKKTSWFQKLRHKN